MSVKCQSSIVFFPFANIFAAHLLQNTNTEHTEIPLLTSSLLLFTFNCSSFNNAVSSSDCSASHGGMMSEYIREASNPEGGSCGPTQGNYPAVVHSD